MMSARCQVKLIDQSERERKTRPIVHGDKSKGKKGKSYGAWDLLRFLCKGGFRAREATAKCSKI